jgi:hypothetical protein
MMMTLMQMHFNGAVMKIMALDISLLIMVV